MAKRRTDADKAKFLLMVEQKKQEGFTKEAAVRELSAEFDITERTGWRWLADYDVRTPSNKTLTRGGVADPKPWNKLSDIAKRMLAPDGYPLFLEKVFGWTIVPWELKAAKVSVEAILDHTQRHYAVANIAPGSGKTSNWTFALPMWLNLGGGIEDPAVGRKLRFQLGHANMRISMNYVKNIARWYASPRPFLDPETGARGEIVLEQEFGRIKPLAALGDTQLWRADQFVIAQLEDIDLTDKDPTFMAVSQGSEYIGSRCEYASWDDLVTPKLSTTIDMVESQSDLFQKTAEQRIEPGGILWLVGQRINSYDLFRDRLDAYWVDEEGETHQKYFHIVFPAHYEPGCTGKHTQWNAEEGEKAEGCLLDAERLPMVDLLKHASGKHFRTLFQQEDSDPASSLVTEPMLVGGRAFEMDIVANRSREVTYKGCYDHDRGWGEFPAVRNLVSYITVDPAVGGKHPTSNWAIEWWAATPAALEDPESLAREQDPTRYLIWGRREIMQAGDLLDWDTKLGFVGYMQKLQEYSWKVWKKTEHTQFPIAPIRAWVIEQDTAFKFLLQRQVARDWQNRWPFVTIFPHETQKNRNDPEKGVQALLKRKYRLGLANLPMKHTGTTAGLNFMAAFKRELLTWPNGATTDTVMADWFGEINLPNIMRVGTRPLRDYGPADDQYLPPYLRKSTLPPYIQKMQQRENRRRLRRVV